MSRTHKDQPDHFSMLRTKHTKRDNHGAHARHVRIMNRLARRDLDRQLELEHDLVRHSRWEYNATIERRADRCPLPMT